MKNWGWLFLFFVMVAASGALWVELQKSKEASNIENSAEDKSNLPESRNNVFKKGALPKGSDQNRERVVNPEYFSQGTENPNLPKPDSDSNYGQPIPPPQLNNDDSSGYSPPEEPQAIIPPEYYPPPEPVPPNEGGVWEPPPDFNPPDGYDDLPPPTYIPPDPGEFDNEGFNAYPAEPEGGGGDY